MATNPNEFGKLHSPLALEWFHEWDLDFNPVPNPNLMLSSLAMPHTAHIPGNIAY